MLKRKHRKQSNIDRKDMLIVEREPNSPISEQYKTLRTNIMFSSVDKALKTVLVTSATPASGKSTTAANLAASFAQAGTRTLLIDADMRKPTLHLICGTRNNRGLSTVIVGGAAYNEVIKEVGDNGLHLMTSGPLPPNPAEILHSNKMKQLLNVLGDTYDMVIIDSPPLLSVTDAQIIGGNVDGTILVTNVKDNNRDHLAKAKDTLLKSNSNILGVVLNNMDMKGNEYYYSYYGEEG